MLVPERQPYAGELVFTAFSGSHQDAIKKGMDLRTESDGNTTPWAVPYLTIDPQDINRNYKSIIRINSQSGKGGIAYILDREWGLDLPKAMHPEVGVIMNAVADKQSKELSSREIHDVFKQEFINQASPLTLNDYQLSADSKDKTIVLCTAAITLNEKAITIHGNGNGPINAFVHALETQSLKNFNLIDYRSHAIGKGSATHSAAYIQVERNQDKQSFWGCGIHTSIEMAGLIALVSAYNRANRDLITRD